MEVSSTHQIYVFALCVVSGMLCGAFFDLQRFIRKLCSAGSVRTALEDVLFAVMCIGVMIGLSFYFNNGEIRYYQIMGTLSGALFYAAALSRIFMKLLQLLYLVFKNVIIKPIVKICLILIIPIKKIGHMLKKVSHKTGKIFRSLKRNVSKRKKRLKKRIKML